MLCLDYSKQTKGALELSVGFRKNYFSRPPSLCPAHILSAQCMKENSRTFASPFCSAHAQILFLLFLRCAGRNQTVGVTWLRPRLHTGYSIYRFGVLKHCFYKWPVVCNFFFRLRFYTISRVTQRQLCFLCLRQLLFLLSGVIHSQ